MEICFGPGLRFGQHLLIGLPGPGRLVGLLGGNGGNLMRGPLTPAERYNLNEMLDGIEATFAAYGMGKTDLAQRKKTREFMFSELEKAILAGTMALKASPQYTKEICDTCGKIIWGTSCPCKQDENQEHEI